MKTEATFVGKNSIAHKVEDALKNSGEKALKRHAANGRPIVITVKGEIVNQYISGKTEKRNTSNEMSF